MSNKGQPCIYMCMYSIHCTLYSSIWSLYWPEWKRSPIQYEITLMVVGRCYWRLRAEHYLQQMCTNNKTPKGSTMCSFITHIYIPRRSYAGGIARRLNNRTSPCGAAKCKPRAPLRRLPLTHQQRCHCQLVGVMNGSIQTYTFIQIFQCTPTIIIIYFILCMPSVQS
jgi:hypothetical protein